MSESPTTKDERAALFGSSGRERLVYVMPEQSFGAVPSDEITLRDIWDIVWRGRGLIVLVTAVFALGSVAYALLADEWYRAEVLLAPAEEKSVSGLGGQLGGLAALAGVTVGGENSAEALASLRSREFARDFIEDYELVPVFFADEWNAVDSQWLSTDPNEWPEIRDAVEYFHDHILSVSEDRETGLVTLAVEWIDPEVSAKWAEVLARRLNARLREQALRNAETNVSYLQEELAKTSVVTLQQSIGRLLESELQQLMLARGNEEFAFRVIDEATPPKDHARPMRAVIVVLGTLAGGMLAVFIVFLRHAFRDERKKDL